MSAAATFALERENHGLLDAFFMNARYFYFTSGITVLLMGFVKIGHLLSVKAISSILTESVAQFWQFFTNTRLYALYFLMWYKFQITVDLREVVTVILNLSTRDALLN